jgi:hypothetical protein
MGPSLGVNQMWTKRKDHGAKSGGGDFVNICTTIFKRMAVFKKIVVIKKNQL